MATRTLNLRCTILFVLLLSTFLYFFPRWADWNQNSRLDLVFAVVDQGTLAIDAYYHNTGDYAYFNGHYYSDKAPGTAFLGIPVYGVFKHTIGPAVAQLLEDRLTRNSALADTLNRSGTGSLSDKVYAMLALTVISLFVVALPSACLGVLLYRLGTQITTPSRALLVTLAYALATPAFAYSNNLYGHQVVAFFLFAAFYILLNLRHGQSRRRRRLWLTLVGAFLGWALITEYPAALIVAGLGLYALRIPTFQHANAPLLQYSNLPTFQRRLVDVLNHSLWFALGAAPPLLLAAAYHVAIFGTPLPVAYQYSVLWQQTHQIGLVSLSMPTLEALWGITFSAYRGLFFFSPILLLSIPGLYYFWRAREWRAEFWVVLWSVASFLIFNASSAMWSGGFAVGPRYLVPALPFLTMPLLFLFNAARSRWVTWPAMLAALISFTLIWIASLGGQMFPQYQPNPLFQYSIPRWVAGDLARNMGMLIGLRGMSSLVPLSLFMWVSIAALVWLGRFTKRSERAPMVAAPTPIASLGESRS